MLGTLEIRGSISPDITQWGHRVEMVCPDGGPGPGYLPWQRLYFLPLPQGHFSLRPILWPASWTMWRFSSHSAQVQAVGCSAYQLGLTILQPFSVGAWPSLVAGSPTMLNTNRVQVKDGGSLGPRMGYNPKQTIQ